MYVSPYRSCIHVWKKRREIHVKRKAQTNYSVKHMLNMYKCVMKSEKTMNADKKKSIE
jgi:hypothetical protein